MFPSNSCFDNSAGHFSIFYFFLLTFTTNYIVLFFCPLGWYKESGQWDQPSRLSITWRMFSFLPLLRGRRT